MPSDLQESVRVPRDRVGALVGKGGKAKRKLEKLSSTKINVGSESGMVDISGQENPAAFYSAVGVVRAIARGFSPEKAFNLLDDACMLDVIKVSDVVGSSGRAAATKKGRVIGRHGIARQMIEKETDTHISVYGKTIGIIGKPEGVEKARKAIEMLLQGARHPTVMDYLRKASAEQRRFSI